MKLIETVVVDGVEITAVDLAKRVTGIRLHHPLEHQPAVRAWLDECEIALFEAVQEAIADYEDDHERR